MNSVEEEVKKQDMNLLEAQMKDMEQSLNFAWEHYLDLNASLDKYRGVKIEKDEDHNRVNEILHDIQIHFATELYPIFKFILMRKNLAENACKGYEDFILSLKESESTEDISKIN